MNTKRKQSGMTLIEILISLAIGMVIVSGIISIYVTTIQSSGATLKNAKLNQELMALVTVMANDIRRAGYDDGPSFTDPQLNPFAQNATSKLVVFNTYDGSVQGSTGSGSCILFTYDSPLTTSGTLDNGDVFGFRLKNGVVEMRKSGAAANPIDSCNDANDTWNPLTDSNNVNVTSLVFNLSNSKCLRTDEPNDIDDDADTTVDNIGEYDCYARVPTAGSDIVTVETRQVAISVSGALASDSAVRITLTDTVRVRNDLVRIF